MYITQIRLIEVDEDGMELPTNFNLQSSAMPDPVQSIKEAAQTAIEALNIITRLHTNQSNFSPDCMHYCSCTTTYCCVCDAQIKEDNLAYSGDRRCFVDKFKV